MEEKQVEHEDMVAEASNLLMHASRKCAKAEVVIQQGDYLIAALEAMDVYEDAERARRLLMRTWAGGREETPPGPTEQETAEWERRYRLSEAAEDLLAACEAARKWLDYTGYVKDSQDVYVEITNAIRKATRGLTP